MKLIMTAQIRLLGAVAILVFATNTGAQILFSDNFNSGASPSWSNLRGAWFTSNGSYAASQPQNIPPTFTGLPYVLQNFAISMDINQVADGGVWLRSDPSGTNGVLLVTGGNGWGSGVRSGNAGRSLYWHVITAANYNNPPKLNEVFNVFNPGVDTVHLRVEVVGNLYSAFLNGSATPVTTLVETSDTYSSGIVGLYDFSSQTFDNVVLEIPLGFGPYPLSIRQADAAHITLLWTTNAINWALESGPSTKPLNWAIVTNTPSVSGTNFSVTLGSSTAGQFFRLHRQ
jgi:hypothetical protein